jgi:hypothetical protein
LHDTKTDRLPDLDGAPNPVCQVGRILYADIFLLSAGSSQGSPGELV